MSFAVILLVLRMKKSAKYILVHNILITSPVLNLRISVELKFSTSNSFIGMATVAARRTRSLLRGWSSVIPQISTSADVGYQSHIAAALPSLPVGGTSNRGFASVGLDRVVEASLTLVRERARLKVRFHPTLLN